MYGEEGRSRWSRRLLDDPAPVLSTACSRAASQKDHDRCQTLHCGCLCHQPGGDRLFTGPENNGGSDAAR